MPELPEGWQDMQMRQGRRRPRNLYLALPGTTEGGISTVVEYDIGRADDEELASEICRRWNGDA